MTDGDKTLVICLCGYDEKRKVTGCPIEAFGHDDWKIPLLRLGYFN